MKPVTTSAQLAVEGATSGESGEPELTARRLRIAIVCILGQLFAGNLILTGSMPLLMLPMTKEFGWTRAEFAYSITALMWFGALAMPLLGRFTDRFGVRPMMLVGTLVMGVLTLELAHQTANLWRLWLTFAVIGIFSSSVPIYCSKMFSTLFSRQRGKALAILSLSIPAALALAPQFANTLFNHFGWRGIYTGNGLLQLAMLPLLYFGLEEPGRESATHGSQPAGERQAPPCLEGLTAAETRKSGTLWLLVAAGVLSGAPAVGWLHHLVAFSIGRGFSQQATVNMLSLTSVGSAFFVLSSGYLVDRFATAKIFVAFALVSVVGFFFQMICSVQVGGVAMLFVGMSLGNLALTGGSMNSYFYTRFFGRRAFAESFGIHMACLSIAGGLAPPLIGMLFERTGSYTTALVLVIIGQVLASGLFIFLGPYRYPATRGVRSSATRDAVQILPLEEAG